MGSGCTCVYLLMPTQLRAWAASLAKMRQESCKPSPSRAYSCCSKGLSLFLFFHIYVYLYPLLHLIWALLILNAFLVSLFTLAFLILYFPLPLKGAGTFQMAKWRYSVEAFSFHLLLDCSKMCWLSLSDAQTGIVSYYSLYQHLKPFSGHFCSNYHISGSGLRSFCSQSLDLFKIPLASSPPYAIHSLSSSLPSRGDWTPSALCISCLAQNSAFISAVFFPALGDLLWLFLLSAPPTPASGPLPMPPSD